MRLWPPNLDRLAHGFEPRDTQTDVVLGNSFHSLAQEHAELVCTMNLCLLSGMLDGLVATNFTAWLEPAPDLCCVRLTPTDMCDTGPR